MGTLQLAATKIMDSESPVVVGRFRKLLTPGFETGLKLPPAFSRMLNNTDLNSITAVLKSCKGSWEVDVKKCDHGCLHFLGKTWEGYVSRHNLKEGDLLVFEHKGHLHFNTIMFDETDCEKYFTTSKEEESIDDDVMSLESSEEDDVEHIAGGSKQNVDSRFQTTLTRGSFQNTGVIYVPIKIVRSNGITKNATVTLRNETGASWLAKLITTYNRCNHGSSFQFRVRITCLSKFFKENRVQVGDKCIFELDHSSGNPKHLVMNVVVQKNAVTVS